MIFFKSENNFYKYFDFYIFCYIIYIRQMAKYRRKENFFVKVFRISLIILLFPIVIGYLLKEKIRKNQIRKSNEEKIKVYNMSQIDHLTGIEFENYLKALFEQMGYAVSLTKKSKDYGADLIISKRGKQTIIQAKCYSHTVGVKAVQEIVSARVHYGIKNAMVITNNYFSREAENFALESGVTLADRVVLEKMIKDFDIRIEKSNTNFSCLNDSVSKELMVKYKYWI